MWSQTWARRRSITRLRTGSNGVAHLNWTVRPYVLRFGGQPISLRFALGIGWHSSVAGRWLADGDDSRRTAAFLVRRVSIDVRDRVGVQANPHEHGNILLMTLLDNWLGGRAIDWTSGPAHGKAKSFRPHSAAIDTILEPA